MDKEKILSQDANNAAERVAQLIASVPEPKRVIAIAIMNAFADGLAAGQQMNAGGTSPV